MSKKTRSKYFTSSNQTYNNPQVEVMKLQRHVRGYLARKNYEKMKNSALVIQSAYRGWVVRRKYTKLRKGVVAVQSLYKMRRQQAIYGEMKTELQRRKEIDATNRARQVCVYFYY